jgi:hypothetical protein
LLFPDHRGFVKLSHVASPVLDYHVKIFRSP